MRSRGFVTLILFLNSLFAFSQTEPASSVVHTYIVAGEVNGENSYLILRNNLSETAINVKLQAVTEDAAIYTTSILIQPRERIRRSVTDIFPEVNNRSAVLSAQYQAPDFESLLSAVVKNGVLKSMLAIDLKPKALAHMVLWKKRVGKSANLKIRNLSSRDASIVVDKRPSEIISTLAAREYELATPDGEEYGAVSLLSSASVNADSTDDTSVAIFQLPETDLRTGGKQIALMSDPLQAKDEDAGVVLHNASSVPIAAVIRVTSYNADGKGRVQPETIELPAHATTLYSLHLQGFDWAAVDLTYTGYAGDVLAMLSVSTESGRSVAAKLRPSRSYHFVGNWQLYPNDSTVIRIANSGDKPSSYNVELYAKDGSARYVIRTATIAPGRDQLIKLNDVGLTARPDSQGRTLDGSMTEGTFEVSSDTSTIFAGTATGTMALLGTWCCGRMDPILVPNPWLTPVNGQIRFIAKTRDGCSNTYSTASVDSLSWLSLDPGIVSLSRLGNATAFAPGGTTVSGDVWVQLGGPFGCGEVYTQTVTAQVEVDPSVSIQGSLGFLFLGHDPQVTQHINAFFGQGTPSGGQYQWSSTDSSISFDNPTGSTAHVTATSYSGGVSDTPISLRYTVNGASASTSVRVTKRLFKYLQVATMTNVGVAPGFSYGYNYSVAYSIYTSPNGELVQPGFSGIAGSEIVHFTRNDFQIQPITAAGFTNDNSQALDTLALQSTSPIPDGVAQATQDIAVGGFFVRNNSLTYNSTTVTITNNGPYN